MKKNLVLIANVRFIILATVLPVHTVKGVINYPKKGGKGKIKEHAEKILAASATSIWVNISEDDINFVNSKITDYGTATQGNRAGRKQLMTQAIEEKLLTTFQTTANADPVNSIAILESGGFHVKVQAIKQIQQFKVINGVNQGEVKLETEGGPKNTRHLHLWYHSLDGGITYSLVDATNSADNILTGYPSDKTIYFKTRLKVNGVLQVMRDAIYVRIN